MLIFYRPTCIIHKLLYVYLCCRGCFDEFNRLVPEVLSVCTVQFKAVCDGVKAESVRIVIESDEVGYIVHS